MAFPTGYTKYQEITIDATKVDADLTDYVVYVNLADLVKTGADIFDTCRTDGGDIRATKSDGTTQLPCEVVAIDTTAKTGELHIKFSGTLSGSTNTIIRIYYNGSDTALAVTDTYGRNAVWSGYRAVYHLNEDPSGSAPQVVDSTGNGVNLTAAGSMTSGDLVDGALGKGLNFDGSNDQVTYTSSSVLGGDSSLSIQVIITPATSTARQGIFGNTDASGPTTTAFVLEKAATTKTFTGSMAIGGTQTTWNTSGLTITDGSANYLTIVKDAGTLRPYKNGAAGTTTAIGTGAINTRPNVGIGSFGSYGSGIFFQGNISEARYRSSALAATWLSTEYNNHSSASTFYSAGNEVSSGGSFNQSLSEVVTITDTMRRATTKINTETVTITETVRRAVTKRLSETATITDVIASLLVKLKSLTETITVTDTIRRATTKAYIETVTITETVRKAITRALTESTTITDTVTALTATYAKILSEVVTITDSFSRVVGYARQLIESVTISERFYLRLNGINAFWTHLYTDTADAWSDLYTNTTDAWSDTYQDI